MKLIQILFIGSAALLLTQNLCAQVNSDANQPCPLYGVDGQIMPIGTRPYFKCREGAWTQDPATDDITLVQIGSTVGPMYNTMSGGDSDGDSLFEAYMYIGVGSTFTYRGYERQAGSNIYNQAFQSSAGLIPYAYGQVDGDNLPDVVGQWSSWVYIYESPALGQYANSQVWQSPAMPNVTGYTTIGDLDQDNQMEIIHGWNSFGSDNRLVIFENTGNNQFQQIFSQSVSNNNTGQKVVADFDGDGLVEVVFSTGGGEIFVFESSGPNALQPIYHANMNSYNAYACVYANDMDNNGRPEFIVGGSSSSQGWITQIYEAIGNDSFAVRQTITISDGYFGLPGLCAGDLDGDGRDEFVMQLAQALRIFDWDSTSQTYTQIQNIPENFGFIQHGIFAFQSNTNANADVFWLGIDYDENTIILETPPVGQPQLDVTLAIQLPYIPPTIPFNTTVVNHGPNQAPFWIWGRIKNPNGTYTAPNLGPVQINPPVGVVVTRLRMLTPGPWPPGLYTQLGYANWTFSYPAVDSSFFTFTIIGSGDGSDILIPYCQGELFPGEQPMAASIPSGLHLEAFPNPFNPTTAIRYQLSAVSHVNLRVFDISGRTVATLAEGMRDAGPHEVTFDGSGLATGLYFVRMQAGDLNTIQKMMLIK
jgi:hypothetical protein